jgi:hypothetical protein
MMMMTGQIARAFSGYEEREDQAVIAVTGISDWPQQTNARDEARLRHDPSYGCVYGRFVVAGVAGVDDVVVVVTGAEVGHCES